MTPGPDDILEAASKAGGEALADAYGWHADSGDYMTARTVIISARPVIEAPLRALLGEVANSGVEWQSTRYALVLISHATWEALAPFRGAT
jgi:hypothetical protein